MLAMPTPEATDCRQGSTWAAESDVADRLLCDAKSHSRQSYRCHCLKRTLEISHVEEDLMVMVMKFVSKR